MYEVKQLTHLNMLERIIVNPANNIRVSEIVPDLIHDVDTYATLLRMSYAR